VLGSFSGNRVGGTTVSAGLVGFDGFSMLIMSVVSILGARSGIDIALLQGVHPYWLVGLFAVTAYYARSLTHWGCL
jgi:multisubunit Na+/H+ antiporter MnhF subunit